ncbi:MAG TPA: DUF4837 family protein [Longimicrobiaceae bacterium]|nr:DUF4837 family protein [Longimicrobiaceae bacterium]
MPTNRRTLRPFLLAMTAVLSVAACDKPQSLGDANSIIVAVPDSAWDELEGVVERALEPRTFTVRDERIFNVTQTDPGLAPWNDLQRFQNILVIGQPSDPWVAQALEEVSQSVPEPPALLRTEDVWAQGQGVTIVLIPEGAGPEEAAPLLMQAGENYVQGFQYYVKRRMFASGEDTALADSLARNAGFSILLPNVYYGEEVEPGVFMYRNDNPDPSELIRSVLVTSRPSDEVVMEPETALQWRAELAEKFTEPPQVTDSTIANVFRGEGPESHVLRIQGVWSNPPGGWPAAGPFLTQLVECPEQGRTYIIDTWLYAPGESKFEYMVQLETILDSFECAGGSATSA